MFLYPVSLSGSSAVVSLMSFKLSQSPALLMSSHSYRSPVWQLLYLYTIISFSFSCLVVVCLVTSLRLSDSPVVYLIRFLHRSHSHFLLKIVFWCLCTRLTLLIWFSLSYCFTPVSLSSSAVFLFYSDLLPSYSPLLLCFCFIMF